MCVVKYACASVILLSVIKLTRKLPNNPTVYYRYQANHARTAVVSLARHRSVDVLSHNCLVVEYHMKHQKIGRKHEAIRDHHSKQWNKRKKKTVAAYKRVFRLHQLRMAYLRLRDFMLPQNSVYNFIKCIS